MIIFLLSFLLFICIASLILTCVVFYRFMSIIDTVNIVQKNISLLAENNALKNKHKEYRQMFGVILEVIQEDGIWIKSTFFQRFGSIPEYQNINSQIISFQNKIDAIKETLKSYRMIETYDEE